MSLGLKRSNARQSANQDLMGATFDRLDGLDIHSGSELSVDLDDGQDNRYDRKLEQKEHEETLMGGERYGRKKEQ